MTNRSLIAKVQTSKNTVTKSDNFAISYGTAQGSCLGPLLFILFTNDIQLLPTFSSIILFVDDTTLFNSTKNDQLLQFSLEHDMLLLMDWYKANKLSLNVDKTVLLKFWSTSKVFDRKVGESTIINSPSTKFLGVIVDDHLTWKDHINQLYCKLTANKWLLMNAKNLLPESCLLKIYYAHVYNHLTYGISVWGKMSQKSSQNSLYRLQKECVSIICKQKGPIDKVFK